MFGHIIYVLHVALMFLCSNINDYYDNFSEVLTVFIKRQVKTFPHVQSIDGNDKEKYFLVK